VIEIADDIDTVAPGLGIGDNEFHLGRLLTSIGSADTRRTESRSGSRADGTDALDRKLPLPCFRPV
jgi:hypothetical protein